MKNAMMIPALIAATFSTGVLAHDYDRDPHGYRSHDRYVRHGHPPPPVFVPPRAYRPAPPVMVRAPIVYRQPVVYAPPPVYAQPVPVYYGPPAAPRYYRRADDRDLGRVVGAVAGGVIGHQIGRGHLGPTVLGAVVGGIVGGEIAGR